MAHGYSKILGNDGTWVPMVKIAVQTEDGTVSELDFSRNNLSEFIGSLVKVEKEMNQFMKPKVDKLVSAIRLTLASSEFSDVELTPAQSDRLAEVLIERGVIFEGK
jgi:hypothetical protein